MEKRVGGKTSEAAKTLSKLGASKGGKARAEALTPEERTQIAKEAVNARWARKKEQGNEGEQEKILKATHGSPDHPLRIGDVEIPCYVLEDGRRVVVQTSMLSALGMVKAGPQLGMVNRLHAFVAQDRLKPFVSNALSECTANPIRFRTTNNSLAYGYEATVLADICETVLSARDAGVLLKQQEHIAIQCDILMRGFARVGIIALIDEATGYQEVRDRLALQEILDKFLRKEFAAWAKRFPDEFYQQIFRLRNWQWRGMKVNRPQIVAHYTKDLIYARLAPGILTELEVRNPKDEKGHRKALHHQFLTDDIGHPALAQLLFGVIGLMRVADRWDEFMRMADKAYPRRNDTLQLSLFQNDEFYSSSPTISVAK